MKISKKAIQGVLVFIIGLSALVFFFTRNTNVLSEHFAKWDLEQSKSKPVLVYEEKANLASDYFDFIKYTIEEDIAKSNRVFIEHNEQRFVRQGVSGDDYFVNSIQSLAPESSSFHIVVEDLGVFQYWEFEKGFLDRLIIIESDAYFMYVFIY